MIKDSDFEIGVDEEVDLVKVRLLVQKAEYNLAQITPKYEKAKSRLDWCKEQERFATEGRYYTYIVFVNAKAVYVGKGKNDRYKHAVTGTSSCLELNRDFFQGKYIEVRFLEKYLTEEKALERENFWISHLKSLAQYDCFGEHGWEIYNKCNTPPKFQFDIGEDYIYHVASKHAISHGMEKVQPKQYDYRSYC